MTDIIRKGQTGEHGNKGEFGTHTRTSDNVNLDTAGAEAPLLAASKLRSIAEDCRGPVALTHSGHEYQLTNGYIHADGDIILSGHVAKSIDEDEALVATELSALIDEASAQAAENGEAAPNVFFFTDWGTFVPVTAAHGEHTLHLTA